MANNVSSDSGRSTCESDNATPSLSDHDQNTSKTVIEVHPPVKHTCSDYDHLEETPAKNATFTAYDRLEESPVKNAAFTVYDRLEPPVDSPYAVLGQIEEVDLTSFAYQIASGMVGYTETPHSSGN